MMNKKLQKLQPYPFEKLKALKEAVTPNTSLNPILLSIGEPKHTPPQFVLDTLVSNLDRIANYPATKGIPELRSTIANWLKQRFNAAVCSEEQILPVSGTREALFAFAQAVIDNSHETPSVVMPNPFYQIYEGAALLAGATPEFLNCTIDNGFIPDFENVPPATWEKCQLIYLCSPGNPSGAVVNKQQMASLIRLADKYDFIIASDECYSELYFDENTPPVGLLQICHELGRTDFARCVVFHSLSKRSNLPGLRSGFVAGDAKIINKFLQYRTYHGCALPVPTQLASIAAWEDEQHVIENRRLYLEKFTAVVDILDGVTDVKLPDASFYIWLKTPIDDVTFAQKLYEQENVTVLPGSFLARQTATGNPGEQFIRIALVATKEECIDAANRLARFFQALS